jgi:hypothetical protein
MTKKAMLLRIWLLIIIINIGIWLMGVYRLEVHIGPYVLGRYININEPQTSSSLFGWFLVISGGIALVTLLYRNR